MAYQEPAPPQHVAEQRRRSRDVLKELEMGLAHIKYAIELAGRDGEPLSDYMLREVVPGAVRLQSVVRKWPRHE